MEDVAMIVALRCTFAASLVGASACADGGQSPSNAVVGNPFTPSANSSQYDGTWKGTTGEGFPVSFGVVDGRIQSFAIGLDEVRGDGCVYDVADINGSSGLGNGTYSADGPSPIVNNSFTIRSVAPAALVGEVPSPQAPLRSQVAFTLTGTFSASSAEGSGTFNFSGACNVTRSVPWQITREP
jgi:hypothetical protein